MLRPPAPSPAATCNSIRDEPTAASLLHLIHQMMEHQICKSDCKWYYNRLRVGFHFVAWPLLQDLRLIKSKVVSWSVSWDHWRIIGNSGRAQGDHFRSSGKSDNIKLNLFLVQFQQNQDFQLPGEPSKYFRWFLNFRHFPPVENFPLVECIMSHDLSPPTLPCDLCNIFSFHSRSSIDAETRRTIYTSTRLHVLTASKTNRPDADTITCNKRNRLQRRFQLITLTSIVFYQLEILAQKDEVDTDPPACYHLDFCIDFFLKRTTE